MKQKKINEKKIYQGKVFSVFLSQFENSKNQKLEREIIKRKDGAAAIIAITPQNTILLVKQYRQAVEELIWEIPAGIIDENETPKETAQRELIEETGYKAQKIEEVMHYYSSAGFTDEVVVIYKATGLSFVGTMPEDEEEFEIKEFTLSQILKMIKDEEINDAKTIIAALLLENERTD